MSAFITLSLVLLANVVPTAHAADYSIFAQAKPCLDALYSVYHPTNKMSDFVYYSPEQPKVTVAGKLLDEAVLFNSEANESYPTSTYTLREGHPTHQSPPDAVWNALKTRFTYALDRLPSTASSNKGQVAPQQFREAIQQCRAYYFGNADKLAEQTTAELARAAVRKRKLTETFTETHHVDSESRGVKHVTGESKATAGPTADTTIVKAE